MENIIMMSKKTKLYKLSFVLLAAVLLMGCSKKQIFKVEGEEYILQAVEDDEMETGIYYVKDTTKFYATHNAGGSANGKVNISSSERLLWTMDDDSLIPTMYKDGLIAFSSQQGVNTEEINIERFEDVGETFGTYDAEIDNNGHIKLFKNKMIKGSAIYEALKKESADAFIITKINNKNVNKDMLAPGGIITGLEDGKTYNIEFYSGTYYKSANIKADTHMYRSFEIYKSTNIEPTKNGYISIYMPDDINCGYYRIDGIGLFKYYNVKKDNVTGKEKFNEAYYKTEAEQISAYSQQYVVNIAQPTYDVYFTAEYVQEGISAEDVIALLTAPDGTTYKMKAYDGTIGINIDFARAGRWTINIAPQALQVTDVNAESKNIADDATVESYDFELEESSNKIFSVHYKGDGEVWGTLSYQDGTAVEFQEDKDNTIKAELTYVRAGKYTVNIYHYADTIIEEPQITDNEEQLSDINIIVESD